MVMERIDAYGFVTTYFLGEKRTRGWVGSGLTALNNWYPSWGLPEKAKTSYTVPVYSGLFLGSPCRRGQDAHVQIQKIQCPVLITKDKDPQKT